MAESIAIHFKDADWDALTAVLNVIADVEAMSSWRYPKGAVSHVTMYPYDDLIGEYEDEDLDRLIDYLGDFPAVTLCIELRRSQGVRACDSAAEIAILILDRFTGVVDDLVGHCWTVEEIKQGRSKENESFLDRYRYPKQPV